MTTDEEKKAKVARQNARETAQEAARWKAEQGREAAIASATTPEGRLLAIAEKLKHVEKCIAASMEGQHCVTAEVRWAGREIARIVEQLRGRP